MVVRLTLILVLGSTLFLQGCETVKSAATGFQKNVNHTWKSASKAQDWMQDNWW